MSEMASVPALKLCILASLALIITPGQDALQVIGRSLAQGRLAGVCSAVGVCLGLLVHTALAALGAGAILRASEALFLALKIVGAAYLAYLAVRLLLTREGARGIGNHTAHLAPPALVWQGLVSSMADPRTALFFFAFLPQFVDPASAHPMRDLVLVGVIYAVLALPVKAGVGIAAASLSERVLRRLAAVSWIQRSRRFPGRIGAAARLARAGLLGGGRDVEPAMSRAAALFGQGKLDEAQALAEEVRRVADRHFYALHLLSTIALRRGEWEEGIRFASRALEVDPHSVEVLCNRGSALRMLHRYSEASADYDRALAIAPGSPVALNNRGVVLAALDRHQEALESFGAALRIQPDYAQARYGRGISRLMVGELAAGWEDHEWRWSGSENAAPMRAFGVPLFTDNDWGRCRRLALWTEQGLGDQLLFSTLVPELEARGQAFVFETDERLVTAFRRTHPAWTVVSRTPSVAAFTGCDRHLPLGSLPRLLRRTRESFERQPKALLAADPVRAARFRSRFESPGARVVGISWRSFQPKMRAYYEGRKNAPLDAFRDLSRSPALRLIDLQYGDTASECAAFARNGGRLSRIEDLDHFNDLDGLLAAIEACDVVVSTSNVTAHLAGCLGKRTFLVYLRANPAFHYWVPDARGRSPWYPSVEIVTDPAMDSWDKAMRRVAERLRCR